MSFRLKINVDTKIYGNHILRRKSHLYSLMLAYILTSTQAYRMHAIYLSMAGINSMMESVSN